ncbi:MAG: GNAT family N-acetyltransferase [Pseudomonadota bacterium]
MSGTGWSCDPASEEDWPWITRESEELGGPVLVSSGSLHDLRHCPAVVVSEGAERAGFLVYRVAGDMLEILAIKAVRPRLGAGSALMDEAERIAELSRCREICLTTTNDNLDALRFYQRRGFAVRAYHIGGFREILRLKGSDTDQVPLGLHGIPIRDSIDLGKCLRGSS